MDNGAELSANTGTTTTVSAIIASSFLMGAGMALQGTALTIRAGIEGFSPTIIGFIMSVYYIGLALGIYVAALVIRRVGFVRSYAAFASLASATAVMHVLLLHPVPWIILRFIQGLCSSVMVVVLESWLNVSSSSENRGRILSIYSIAYLASMGLGQPLIGLFSPATFEIFAITSILISLCLLPITLANVTGNPVVKGSSPHLARIFLRSPLSGIGLFVSGLVYGASWSLIPRYAQSVNMDEGEIGILMLLVSIGTLAFQWPLGWISDRKDRRRAIFISASAAGICSLFIAVSGASGPLLFLLVLIFGGFSMPLYSLCVALLNDQLNIDEMVHAAGAITVFFGIGSSTGPIISGMFMGLLGGSGLFYSMAVPLGLFVLYSWLRIKLVPMIIMGKKRSFRVYPRGAAAFSMLAKIKPGKKDRKRRINL